MGYSWIPLLIAIVALASTNFEAAAFSMPPQTSSTSSTTTCLHMATNKKQAYTTGGADGLLAAKNRQRVKTAGRRGTKRFVDPCKVFIGNLPFDATNQDVLQFFHQYLGTTFNVKSVKIIKDWKSGKSKGYGFCLFTDPMFATSAMEVLQGKSFKGRPMTLSQGKKKPKENEVYVEKQKKKAESLEDEAIQAGLDEASSNENEDNDNDTVMEVDDFDEEDDVLLFESEDDEDEDDFEFDGVFEEIYPSSRYQELTEEEQLLNREQRRDVAKRKKRRKLPHKGFEPPPEDL